MINDKGLTARHQTLKNQPLANRPQTLNTLAGPGRAASVADIRPAPYAVPPVISRNTSSRSGSSVVTSVISSPAAATAAMIAPTLLADGS